MSKLGSILARRSRRSATQGKRSSCDRLQRAVSEALERRTLLSNYIVTTAGDDSGVVAPTQSNLGPDYFNAVTLRDAIEACHSGSDTITFSPAVFSTPQTITLLQDRELQIIGGQEITIMGTGPGPGLVTISGNNNSRVFNILGGSVVDLQNLTITKGHGLDNDGGGIANVGNLTISDCLITGNVNNTGSAGNGAGIFNLGALTIEDSTISGNTATGYGGGIYNLGAGVNVSYSTINGNSAGVSGGGVTSVETSANEGQTNLTNCTLTSNTAETGGAIENEGMIMFVVDSTISANTSTFGVGAGIEVDPNRNDDPSTLAMSSDIVAGNHGTSDIDFTHSNSGPNYSRVNCLIGVDHLSSSPLDQNGNIIIHTADPMLAPLGDYGGPTQTMPPLPGSEAIGSSGLTTLFGKLLTEDQRHISRPSSLADMGAFQTGPEPISTVNPDGFQMEGTLSLRDVFNLANVMGGDQTIALPALATPFTISLLHGPLTVTDTTGTITLAAAHPDQWSISGSHLSSVFNVPLGAKLQLKNLSIINGNAQYGGGIFNSGTLGVTDSSISGNTASTDGGGIMNYGSLTLTHVTISNNTAGVAGGGIDNADGTLTITGGSGSASVIDNNHANIGGGLANLAGTAKLTNVEIAGNTATTSGGGIITAGALTLNDCTVSGNTSTAGAGGGINQSADDTATISNSTISGNSSHLAGGGIEAAGTMTITDSTNSANSGGTTVTGGGGIYTQAGSHVSMLDTIVDGNTTFFVLAGQHVPDDLKGVAFTGSYNLIGQDDTGSFTSTDGRHDIIAADPMLSALAPNGGPTQTMALSRLSPAINEGLNAYFGGHLITTDQQGNARTVGSAPDIGAYEYQGSTGIVFGNINSYVVNTGSLISKLNLNLEQGGQIVKSASAMVTLTIASGPAGAMIDGMTSIMLPVVNGMVNFNNLMFSLPGTYTLKADDGVDPPTISPTFSFFSSGGTLGAVIEPGSEPASAIIGQPLASPVIVDITQDGQLLTTDVSTVTLYLTQPGDNGVDAAALASKPVTIGTGKATFSNLVIPANLITHPGADYVLVAFVAGYGNSTSDPFPVNLAPAAKKLVFNAAPTSPIQGVAFSPALSVNEEDSNGIVMSNDSTSTVSLAVGLPGGGTSTVNATVVNGVATFPYTPSLAGAYTFTATENGYTSGQSAFSVEASVTHLVFATQPVNIMASQAIASPANPIIVYVENQNGTIIPSNDTVTISVFPFSAFLAAQVTLNAVNGVATFGTSSQDSIYLGLNFNVLSSRYWLIANDNTNTSALPATSNPFIVTPGPPTVLVMSSPEPSVGASFDISVQAIDLYKETATSEFDQLTLSVLNGPAGVTLVGTPTTTLVNGVATFNDLSFSSGVVGTYQLAITDAADPLLNNFQQGGTVAVIAGAPAQLAFMQQPGSAAAGAAIGPPITVAVEDQFGNLVTTDDSQVTLYIANGPGTELDGVVTVAAQNGVATFDSVSVGQAGAGFQLGVSDDAGDTNAVSHSFDIVPPTTFYVDQYASGANNGQDWADAFTHLQSALSLAVPGDSIDVAQGGYSPGDNPTDTFQLIDGVTLQGGYPTGGATDPSLSNNATILDGKNVNYHVVTGNGTDSSAELEGFTIKAGNADGSGDTDSGSGGGLIADGGSPTIIDCIFTGNSAIDGGAVFNTNQPSNATTLINCLFVANTATQSGGAMYNLMASPTISSCTFTANSAAHFAGAIENDEAYSPILTNDIFWNDIGAAGYNEIGNDLVLFLNSSQPVITNCDVGVTDPLFVDPANGNYQLQPTSPLINAGDDSDPVLSGIGTDLQGDARFVDGVIDQGAYESQAIGVTWTGQGDGINWSDSANWSDNLVPTQNDDVSVGASFSAVQIQVGSGSYAVHSLNSAASIEVVGGSFALLAPSTINGSFTLQSDGTLDITGASLAINYGTGTDPASIIAGYIQSAYDSGRWDMPGLASTTAADSPFVVGYSDDTVNHVFVAKQTFAGDFNLDGRVNTADFVLLADNFNQSGSDLPHGDANYDGRVNALDFNALATNFGQSTATAQPLSAPLTPTVRSALAVAAAPKVSLFGDISILGASNASFDGNGDTAILANL